jgi:hypothetical protein
VFYASSDAGLVVIEVTMHYGDSGTHHRDFTVR